MGLLQPASNQETPQGKALQQYTIQSFAGGLVTNYADNALLPDQFTKLLNLYIEPNGTLRTRGPFRPWLAASDIESAMPGTVIERFWFSRHGTQDVIFAITDNGTKLWTWNATENCWVQVTVPAEPEPVNYLMTSASRCYFTDYTVNAAKATILANGVDPVVRYEDGQLSPLGLEVPEWDEDPAIKGAISIADFQLGMHYNGPYYYKITYSYSNGTRYGESGPSAAFPIEITGIVAAEDAAQVTIGGLPDLPDGAYKANLYRCRGSETGIYKYVGAYTEADITDGEGVFTDSTPDDEEGHELDADTIDVPVLNYPIVIKGRLVGADMAVDGKVVWSDTGAPDIFRATSFYYLPDPITGMAVFNRNLYIFTAKDVYVVHEGDIHNNTPLKATKHGTISQDSIKDVGTGLTWLSEDGVYWSNFNTQAVTGDFAIAISDVIKDQLDTIAIADRQSAVAIVHDNRYYLSFKTPFSTTGHNDTTLVWNALIGHELLSKGRVGGWSKVNWTATHAQVFNGNLYTAGTQTFLLNPDADPEDQEEGGYIYEHNFPSSGVIHDYATKWRLDNAILGNFTIPNQGIDSKFDNPQYDPEDPESEPTVERPPVIQTQRPLSDITIPAPGFLGAAITFNGTSDYIDIEHTDNQVADGGIGVSIWISPTGFIPPTWWTDSVVVIAKKANLYDNTDPEHPVLQKQQVAYALQFRENGVSLIGCDGPIISAEFPIRRVWTHLCFNWIPGGNSELWINGISQGDAETPGKNENWNDYDTLKLGGAFILRDNWDYFEGAMSTLGLFNRPLTDDEVAWLYNEGQGRNTLTEGSP